MTIPQSRYIKIRDVVRRDNLPKRRNLSGLVFTENRLAPFGYILEMGSADAVRRYFGRQSAEYGFAKTYFSSMGYGEKTPTRILFTRCTRASDGVLSPTMMSQTNSVEVSEFRDFSEVDLQLVINTTGGSYEVLFSEGAFSECICLADVCAIYNGRVAQSSESEFPPFVRESRLSYENGRFVLRFGNTESEELLPCGETKLAVALGFTESQNVVVSDGGGDADGMVGAISRVANSYDDFGSFCFLFSDDETVQWSGQQAESYWRRRAEDVKRVDAWLEAENYRFVHVAGFDYMHSSVLTDMRFGASTHLVMFGADAYRHEESMAMGILSTIDYDAPYEAEYSWMFRSNPSLIPLDISESEAYALVDRSLNFYGLTQEIGAVRAFYQPGKNADGSDTSAVCAEIWLKDAIQTAIIDRFLSDEKVSQSASGVEKLGDDISYVIQEAVNNRTITVPESLTDVQKVYVNQVFGGNPRAAVEVETDGYCLSVSYDGDTVVYVLLYHKNGNFRKIEGTHVA